MQDFRDFHQGLFQNNQYLRSFFIVEEFVDNARLNLDEIFFEHHTIDKPPRGHPEQYHLSEAAVLMPTNILSDST